MTTEQELRALVARSGRHWSMPFGAGDYVRLRVDPRHLGRVRYAHATQVRVQWGNGWISEHDARELEREP